MKSTQANKLKAEFEKSLQDYKNEELNYRNQYRQQIARQYRIVNPDASEAEVEEASQLDWGSEGVFQTAVCLVPLSYLIPPVCTINRRSNGVRNSLNPTVPAKHLLF